MNWFFDCYGTRTYNGTWNSNKEEADRIVKRAFTKKQISAYQAGKLRIFIDELHPVYGAKSFYGKARIVTVNGKNSLEVYLISYNTAVAKIDNKGRFIRLWDDYSATTQRHIDSFMDRFGMRGLGKAEWLALPIGTWGRTREVTA